MKFLRSYKYTLISILLFLFSLFLGSVGVARFAIIATCIVFILELYGRKIERDFEKMCERWASTTDEKNKQIGSKES